MTVRRALPDLDRVVLDPAGLRQDLLVLELVAAHLVAAVVEDHEAGAGGALVDGADEVSHGGSPQTCGVGGLGQRSTGASRARYRRARTVLLGQVPSIAAEDRPADEPADDRRDDRQPEVDGWPFWSIHAVAVPGDARREPGPEVAGGVDRVAGVGAPRHPDRDDEQADDDRAEVGQRRVVDRGGHGEDHEDEDRGADDLVEEGRREGHRGASVARQGGEDALGLDGVVGVDDVDQVGVGEADDDGGDERARRLGQRSRAPTLRHGNPLNAARAMVTAGLRWAPDSRAAT